MPAETLPATLVQISDLHVSLPGRLVEGRVDTNAALRRALSIIRRLHPRPLAILATGDLVDRADPAEYAELQALLARLPAPLLLMGGNHDDKAALRDAFPGHPELDGRPGSGWIHDLPGLRVIGLDTVVTGRSHGELLDDQLDWLDLSLAAEPRRTTLIAMHHPPFGCAIPMMDKIGLRAGVQRLRAIVARHSQVERLVAGHVHRSVQVRFESTIAITAPSTAHQIDCELDPARPGGFTLAPPGFLLHAWGPGQPLVSHLLSTRRFRGPYRYE